MVDAAARETGDAYVERYRLTGALQFLIPLWMIMAGVFSLGGVGFVVAAFTQESETDVRVVLVVLGLMSAGLGAACGAGGVRWGRAARSGRVAFRVDRNGVTLGAQPFPIQREIAVGWPDLAAIELNRRRPLYPRVGLVLRPRGSSSGGAPASEQWRNLVIGTRRWLTGSAATAELLMRGWTLDLDRLSVLVASYSPTTDIVPLG